jgi:predicted transcriptional regulator
MGIEEMKREIKHLLKEENDLYILKHVHSVLTCEIEIREFMNESAIRAEEDIKAGRVYTAEEAMAHIRAYLHMH